MIDKEQAIQSEYRQQMNELAKFISSFFPGSGFALLVFRFGEPDTTHRMNYISNARRADMLRAMKEFIERIEKEHGVAT